MSGTEQWISVRNWRRFQHYDPEKRQPPWIKVYTELMSDDAFLGLSGNDRAVLICLWLEYASSRCRIRLDTVSSTSRHRFGTRSLSRRLNLRITPATLERLNHAGHIDIVASATLAEGYHTASTVASARAHATEVEVEKERTTTPKDQRAQHPCPKCGLTFNSHNRVKEHLDNVHWLDNESGPTT